MGRGLSTFLLNGDGADRHSHRLRGDGVDARVLVHGYDTGGVRESAIVDAVAIINQQRGVAVDNVVASDNRAQSRAGDLIADVHVAHGDVVAVGGVMAISRVVAIGPREASIVAVGDVA